MILRTTGSTRTDTLVPYPTPFRSCHHAWLGRRRCSCLLERGRCFRRVFGLGLDIVEEGLVQCADQQIGDRLPVERNNAAYRFPPVAVEFGFCTWLLKFFPRDSGLQLKIGRASCREGVCQYV